MIKRLSIAALLLLAAAAPASSRTWLIRPDGSGDAPTIQAGVDSAAVGDSVLAACGTFLEHDIRLKSGISLQGNGCATIDASLLGVILICESVTDVQVGGLRFTSGGWTAGAVRCVDADVDFTECVFEANYAVYREGGGLDGRASTITLERCTFRYNSATFGGGLYADASEITAVECLFEYNSVSDKFGDNGWGAGAFLRECASTIVDCRFAGNTASSSGGGIEIRYGDCSIEGTVFHGNSKGAVQSTDCSLEIVGSLFVENTGSHFSALALQDFTALTTVSRCSFIRNSVSYEGGSTISLSGSNAPTLEASILAFGRGGSTVRAPNITTLPVSCCDVIGNENGDWIDALEGMEGVNGNFSAWPLFCDPEAGDLRLSANSICLPDNNSCGVQIGCFGLGCGPVSVAPKSWSQVKALFR